MSCPGPQDSTFYHGLVLLAEYRQPGPATVALVRNVFPHNARLSRLREGVRTGPSYYFVRKASTTKRRSYQRSGTCLTSCQLQSTSCFLSQLPIIQTDRGDQDRNLCAPKLECVAIG